MRVWLRDYSPIPYSEKFSQVLEDGQGCTLEIVDDGVLATSAEHDHLYPWAAIRTIVEFTGNAPGKARKRAKKKP
jgi:hypothetical protein